MPDAAIAVFACGTALDRLGPSRLDADIRLTRLTCVGRLNAGMLLAAIESGTRRVMVLGCADSSCRHLNGPALAAGQVKLARTLLDTLGLDPEAISVELVDRAGNSAAADLTDVPPGSAP